MIRLLRVVLIVATAPALLPVVLGAQEPPALRLTRDLKIDAVRHDLSPIDWITVAPNGTIVVQQPQDSVLRFFDTNGGTPVGRISVPAAVYVMVASRANIWGTETDDDGLQHVVRYRVSR